MAVDRIRPEWMLWFDVNEDGLRSHGTPYELMFARKVLQHVESLRPEWVALQVPFVDLQGGRRYLDFALECGGMRIAVEVDGWDKTGTGQGMSKEEFEDFLDRQNAITAEGWTLLRFANSFFTSHPELSRTEIDLSVRQALDAGALKAAEEEELKRLRSLTNDIGLLRKQMEAHEAALGAARATAVAAQMQTLAAIAAREEAERRAAEAEDDAAHERARHQGELDELERLRRRTHHQRHLIVLLSAAALILAATAAIGLSREQPLGVAAHEDGSCPTEAPIKGNRSLRDSEAIYHVPDGQFYDATTAVRCFADEDEAIAAGFRRSLR